MKTLLQLQDYSIPMTLSEIQSRDGLDADDEMKALTPDALFPFGKWVSDSDFQQLQQAVCSLAWARGQQVKGHFKS